MARIKNLDVTQPIDLNDDSVKALPFATNARGKYIVRDKAIKELRCVVNRNRKLMVFQSEVRRGKERESIYLRLGDPTIVEASEWRARALDEKARQTRRKDPDAKAGTTFAEAWEDPVHGYKAGMVKANRSPRSIDDYQHKFEKHLTPEFGNVALRDITRKDVVEFHARLTRDSGPYAANGTCRVGHAIYRHAVIHMEVPELNPLNPFRASKLFNKEKARQTGLSEKGLGPWFSQILALENPIMREFYFITMLTGLRRRDVTTMRWEHVKKDHIVIPAPKGGEERQFKCPITPAVARALKRLKRAGAPFESPWVFPSTAAKCSKSGHIEEVKKSKLDHSPHALRHTFRTLCAGAKVSTVHSRLLMNHAVSREVHESYMTVDSMFQQLRDASTDLSAYIVRHLPKGAEKKLDVKLTAHLTAK